MSLREWFHQPRAAKRMLLILTLATVFQATALGVLLWPEAEQWDPIIQFQEQAVLNEAPVYYTGHVIVQGKKCYKEPVTIVGRRWWATETPAGSVISDGGGIRQQAAGCKRFYGPDAFQNLIPVSVAELDQELRLQGFEPAWYIYGTEHAERPDGEWSVERTWRTESFRFAG